MNVHRITRAYAACAQDLDTAPNANWFHFAAWGTYTVNKVIASAPETPMGRALARAEERIYESVMVTRPHQVTRALRHYELARENPENARALIQTGTLTIARFEQHLIDADIYEAFAAAPLSPELLTSMLYVEFPTEKLYLGQDVPGFPNTAVKDWRDYDQRMTWISACIAARQQDPTLHRQPVNYHAMLGSVA